MLFRSVILMVGYFSIYIKWAIFSSWIRIFGQKLARITKKCFFQPIFVKIAKFCRCLKLAHFYKNGPKIDIYRYPSPFLTKNSNSARKNSPFYIYRNLLKLLNNAVRQPFSSSNVLTSWVKNIEKFQFFEFLTNF